MLEEPHGPEVFSIVHRHHLTSMSMLSNDTVCRERDSNPQNLVFETSTYTSSITPANCVSWARLQREGGHCYLHLRGHVAVLPCTPPPTTSSLSLGCGGRPCVSLVEKTLPRRHTFQIVNEYQTSYVLYTNAMNDRNVSRSPTRPINFPSPDMNTKAQTVSTAKIRVFSTHPTAFAFRTPASLSNVFVYIVPSFLVCEQITLPMVRDVLNSVENETEVARLPWPSLQLQTTCMQWLVTLYRVTLLARTDQILP
jgi:hypothetical protein